MKSFTDIKQSKKLAEILPLDSADMCYKAYKEEGGIPDYQVTLCPYQFASWIGVPCWSIVALLNVIKPINENTYTIKGTLDGGAIISFDEATSIMFQEEEIIDAVFEMVVWLKEIGKL